MARRSSGGGFAIVIILTGIFLVSDGVAFVKAAMSMPQLGMGLSGDIPPRSADLGKIAQISGVRPFAREELARRFWDVPLNMQTIAPAREAIGSLLEVKPLAGLYWLRLAELKAASGDAIPSVVGAYQLSVYLAPSEGDVMLLREAFGVRLWDVLSPDDQRSVITDLVTVWGQRPARATRELRDAILSLSADDRREIRGQIRLRARLSDDQLAGIGL